jgi:NitT/TauT family transport system substrate-binding protein
MMREIAKLVGTDKVGRLDEAAYQRTVDILMSGKSDVVIAKKPEGAFTQMIWERAHK